MIGQPYSMSQHCGFIRFVGGPYDGQRGLYDSNRIDAIGFSHPDQRCTHEYVPVDKGRSWDYAFKGTYRW